MQWIPDSRYWIPDPLSVELEFQIPIFTLNSKALSCIPDSKGHDSRLHRKNLMESEFHKYACPDCARKMLETSLLECQKVATEISAYFILFVLL